MAKNLLQIYFVKNTETDAHASVLANSYQDALDALNWSAENTILLQSSPKKAKVLDRSDEMTH